MDYEYERAGTAAVFMVREPLGGWREASAARRQIGHLMEARYANCEMVTLVLDNLNTHTEGTFHEAFEPTRARDLVRRIEVCY